MKKKNTKCKLWFRQTFNNLPQYLSQCGLRQYIMMSLLLWDTMNIYFINCSHSVCYIGLCKFLPVPQVSSSVSDHILIPSIHSHTGCSITL